MLEGKKKWTIALIGFVTAILGMLVTLGYIGEGTEDAGVQMASMVVPLLVAALYDVIQGWIDGKKEEVKILTLKMGMPAPKATQTGVVDESMEFDVVGFHAEAREYAKLHYRDFNEKTLWQSARDLGATRWCPSNLAMVGYWEFLSELGNAAWAWAEKMLQKLGPCHPRWSDVLHFKRDIGHYFKYANQVQTILERGLDWRSKIDPVDQTYGGLGFRSSEILKPYTPAPEQEEILVGKKHA